MTHYLTSTDGKIWRWIDDPQAGRLEEISALPEGAKIDGRINDRGPDGIDIRLDSWPKKPIM